MVTFKGIMYLLQSLFSQTMKVRAPSNQKILGAIEGPELPLLGMVISFYFFDNLLSDYLLGPSQIFHFGYSLGLCLKIFLLCLLGFFYWDFFIWTCYWDFLIWTFYGKIFIGTFYEYFFIGTFVAFILDLLSVLFLGLFSSMGFFPLFPVNSFDFWEVVFPETE